MQKLKIFFILIIFLVIPSLVSADFLSQRIDFFIDSSYDLEAKEEISATLKKITPKIYFYLADDWWNELEMVEQGKIEENLESLSQEFEEKIYPTLTSTFGSEWSPGIDNDERITVLIHPMVEKVRGYFNGADEYPRAQVLKSNEREMLYLNAQYIDEAQGKIYLAHEFIHLITFNQKERIQGVFEETWLNEARAEYVSTILGYDDIYEDSNLQKRVRNFLDRSSDSLTEWRNEEYDYGVVNLFTQYLVDHYGLEILVDSLKSPEVGMPSINYALEKNGFGEDFPLIFTQWTITALVNNCSLGEKYCYLNPNLNNFRVNPQVNFLPLSGESTLQVTNATYNWAGNWQKIIGGKGTLTLEFDGEDLIDFKVPYLVCDYQEKCQVSVLVLDEEQKGKITISEFNTKYTSLTIVPSIQAKVFGFDGFEPTYLFSWIASIVEKTEEEKEAELIEELLVQIELLKAKIAQVQAQINAILAERGQLVSCLKFENNLYYGITNNDEVKCLQEFLKNQGTEIYPEGLVTGNFLSLTQIAVILFQEKYAEEILAPLDLEKGTGYFGFLSRQMTEKLIHK